MSYAEPVINSSNYAISLVHDATGFVIGLSMDSPGGDISPLDWAGRDVLVQDVVDQVAALPGWSVYGGKTLVGTSIVTTTGE